MRLSYAGRSFLWVSIAAIHALALSNSLVHLVRVNLGGIADVGVVEEVLNTENDLGSASNGEENLTCLIEMAGFQDFSSSRMLRQMVPDG